MQEGSLSYGVFEMVPRAGELVEEIVDSVCRGCKVALVFDRLPHHPVLKPFRDVLNPLTAERKQAQAPGATAQPHAALREEEEELTPEELFLERMQSHHAWHDSWQRMNGTLQAAYEEVWQRLVMFQRPCERSQAATEIDVRSVLLATTGLDAIRDVGEILGEFREQLQALGELPKTLGVRLLHVDLADVARQLALAPQACLQEAHVILPEMVTDQGAWLTEWMKERQDQFLANPNSLADFVQQARDLESISLDTISHLKHLEYIKELCDLLDLNQIDTGVSGRAQAANIQREFGDFRQWIASREFEASLKRDGYAAELLAEQSRVAEAVSDLTDEVFGQELLVIGTVSAQAAAQAAASSDLVELAGVETTVEDIDKVHRWLLMKQARIHGLQQEWALFNSYEEFFGQNCSTLPKLEKVTLEVERQLALYSAQIQDHRLAESARISAGQFDLGCAGHREHEPRPTGPSQPASPQPPASVQPARPAAATEVLPQAHSRLGVPGQQPGGVLAASSRQNSKQRSSLGNSSKRPSACTDIAPDEAAVDVARRSPASQSSIRRHKSPSSARHSVAETSGLPEPPSADESMAPSTTV